MVLASDSWLLRSSYQTNFENCRKEVFKCKMKSKARFTGRWFWMESIAPVMIADDDDSSCHTCAATAIPEKLYVWFPTKGNVGEIHHIPTETNTVMRTVTDFILGSLRSDVEHYFYVCRCETKTAAGEAGVKLVVDMWNEVLFLAVGLGGNILYRMTHYLPITMSNEGD